MVVLVVGGTGLLGSAITSALSRTDTVIAVSRHKPEKPHEKVHYIQADISKEGSQLVEQVIEQFGHIDTVILNAVLYDLGPLNFKKPSVFTDELVTNLVGPLEIINSVLNTSLVTETDKSNSENNRSILFITSGSGLGFVLNAGQATYSAIKSAQHMLTKHMAAEYSQYGVRVNAVAPGSLKDSDTFETTLEEIENCVKNKDIKGQIRAVVGTNVQII